MATYNSLVYATGIGQNTTAVGTAAPIPQFVDALFNGGTVKKEFVSFDTGLQNLAIGDVINVAILPEGVLPISIKVTNPSAETGATVQLGIAGTANYFTTTAESESSATQQEAFTNLANYGVQTTAPTTVIATIAGAGMTSGKLFFVAEYLSN